MTNRKIEYWVIPPEADAEFVAGREDVLETYEKPKHLLGQPTSTPPNVASIGK